MTALLANDTGPSKARRRAACAHCRDFTGVRRRLAGSFQALYRGEHCGTFLTEAEAIEAVAARTSPKMWAYIQAIRASVP